MAAGKKREVVSNEAKVVATNLQTAVKKTKRKRTTELRPVRQQEGTDVRHGRRRGSEFGQRHDVLEGDIGLRAHVGHAGLLRRKPLVLRGGPDDLDDDGLSSDGRRRRRRLILLRLGEVTPVYLRRQHTFFFYVGIQITGAE